MCVRPKCLGFCCCISELFSRIWYENLFDETSAVSDVGLSRKMASALET